ncbi:MAG: fibronectin type III domain-containing protein [Pirellulales bacterium]
MRSSHSTNHHARRIRFEALEPRHMLAFLAGDYNLSSAVDQTDYDVWGANFGQIGESPADGNGDGTVNAADYTVWRDNLGKTLADVSPDAPRAVEAAAIGSTSIQVTWQASSNASSYAVQRRLPDTETEFTTIAPSVAGTTYSDNTATSGTLSEYRVVAQNANGSSVASQTAQATANQSNLTAYRPQAIHDSNNLVDAPIYDTFPKRPVREQDEGSNTLGPGIRMNFDDDNINGIEDVAESGIEIPEENDLIEVRVDRLPGQGDLVLETITSFKLGLYYTHDKEMLVPLDQTNPNRTEPLAFMNNTVTVYVEWRDATHSFESLNLVDPATGMPLDGVRFHSFKSLIVAFGGLDQNPADTDGDGSIGDPVQGGPNREGIFDIAQSMYDTGWDVLAFGQADETVGVDVPSTEIVNAHQQRFVERHAVIGYSYGGGATHDLIEELDDFIDPLTHVGVFLDAVDQFGINAENDWPNIAIYLLNIYSQINEPGLGDLGGADIDDDEVEIGATLEEINTTTDPGWNNTLDHFSIDDDPQVQELIRTRLQQRLQVR